MVEGLEKEIDRLREILWSERDPQGRVFVPLADAYRRMGDLPLARSMIEEGLERLPEFASAHVVAGWIHQEMVSPVEAEQSFRRVLELDPENTVALEAMGGLAGARGSHAEAAEYLRRLSVLDPKAAGDGGGEGADGGVAAEDDAGVERDPTTAVASGEIDLEGEALPAENADSISVAELAPDDDGITDGGYRSAPKAHDDAPGADDDAAAADDATLEIPVADLAPDEGVVPPTMSVAALAPDIDGSGDEDVDAVAPDLGGYPEGGDGPRVGDDPSEGEAVHAAAIPVSDLAPDAPPPESGISVADLAPDEEVWDDQVPIEALAPDDEPFDFAAADLSGATGVAGDAGEIDAGSEVESWVEPVGGFLAGAGAVATDESLSISSVFRSLLEYEPLPAADDLHESDGGPGAVADWSWSPVEAAPEGEEGASAALQPTDETSPEGADSEAAAAADEEPGPDDFQAWLERNSL